MTVTLELTPDAEAAARAEAQAQGVALEHYLQTFLESALPRSTQDPEAIRRQRMEILGRLEGKDAGLPGGSEEFAAQKAGEKAREERPYHGHLS